MTQEPQSERFSDRHNITVGKARVIYGPRNVGWSTMNVYHLPGQQIKRITKLFFMVKTLKPRVAMAPGRKLSATERPRGDKWQRTRSQYFARYPLCAHCAARGDVALAVELDHVTPLSQGGHAWDWANLQGLCLSCHLVKSRSERR